MKNSQNSVTKHTKGAFRAWKTLQNTGYIVVGYMEALVFEPRSPSQ